MIFCFKRDFFFFCVFLLFCQLIFYLYKKIKKEKTFNFEKYKAYKKIKIKKFFFKHILIYFRKIKFFLYNLELEKGQKGRKRLF